MYSLFADKTVLPAIDFVMGTRFYRYLKLFRESQWWDEERLRDYQNMLLRKLVKHCYENVPYYSKTFRKLRLKPEDINTTKDLEKLPIIDKQIIRDNYEDFFTYGIERKKLIKRSTSGSTGEPFTYYLDKESWSVAWALMFRCWEVSGWKFGDKRCSIGGSALISDEKQSLFEHLRNRIENNSNIYATHIDSRDIVTIVNEIKRMKPEFIRGYPSVLAILSEKVINNNIKIHDVKAIFSIAEKLFPHQRGKIEAAFKCPCFECYGGSEVGFFTMECEFHNGLHFCMDSGIFEILVDERIAGIDEIGELVGTNLYNYAMPFIRYRTNDMVENKMDWNCKCRREFPLARNGIEGRKNEILKFSNGKILHFHDLSILMLRFDLIRYQIVQTGKESLELRLVKGKNFNNHQFKDYLQKLQELTGKEVKINYKYMEKLPKSKSGKLQFIFSEMSN